MPTGYSSGRTSELHLGSASVCIAMQAATRGDGNVGEDAFQAALHTGGIPATVQATESFTVRGELHITKDDFAALNAERASAGLAPFASARNAAAGAARLLAGWETRRLRFAAFEYIPLRQQGGQRNSKVPLLQSHWDGLQRLKQLGFGCVGSGAALAGSIDEAVQAGQALLDRRDQLAYETDGAVVKVNSLQERSTLSLAAHLHTSTGLIVF